jgi:hypothetical protein
MVGLGGLETTDLALISIEVVGPAPRNTGSLISTGAYFTSADDLASVSSDVAIDVSQTTAWKTHLLPESLSRHG